MNIIAPINPLGYGVTGLNFVKELSKLAPVSLWPIGQPQVTTKEDANIVKNCMNNAHLFMENEPCIRIWHQHDMAQFVGHGTKIGFPIFELERFSALERHHLNSVDRLFVCSKWAKQVCLMNEIKPRQASLYDDAIDVIPLGVDREIFKPSDIKNGPTIFFNCGKWEVRKGHIELPELFNRAFSEDDNVELWMMTSNPFLTKTQHEEWVKIYKNTKLGSKIKFLERVETHSEVYNIMAQVDCGIFPTRTEGWNLEVLELMSCGKHIITTNTSGQTEFCNTGNSFLVNLNEEEVAFDGKWFLGNQGNWPAITEQNKLEFIEHLKSVHSLKQNNKLDINTKGIETSKDYTWSNSAKLLLEKTYEPR